MRRSSRATRLRGLASVLGSVLIGAATLVAQNATTAQSASKPQDAKAEQAQRAELQAIIPAVDELAGGKTPADATLPLTWEHTDFVKAQQDKTYVPFTVALDPSVAIAGTAAVYVRAVRHGGDAASSAAEPQGTNGAKKPAEAPKYAFEDLTFLDVPAAAEAGAPRRLRRAFAVAPGDYDVYVAVRVHAAPAAAAQTGGQPAAQAPAEKAPEAAAPGTERLGVVKQAVTVPDFSAPDLTTSSIIVADRVDVLQAPVAEVRQADNPYTFGQMRIVPSSEYSFSKKRELLIVFWIYGAALDPNTKKPDVNIEFKFYQKSGDKETYFNKTDPQPLNAQTLPAQFDPSAGHQLPGSLGMGLASFPEGQYRLQIEVTDKVANKTVKRDVGFTVTS